MPSKLTAKRVPVLKPASKVAQKASPKALAPAAPTARTEAAFTAGVAAPSRQGPTSQIDFNVHPGIAEIRNFAALKGWASKGWTQVSTYGVEIVYSSDQWKTTKTASSSQVPSPYMNGRFLLAGVPKGTSVEFAIKTFVAVSDLHDIGGHRDRGEVWLNNGGRNYTQVTQ